MVLANLSRSLARVLAPKRTVNTVSRRNMGGQYDFQEGHPGQTLPITIKNRVKFTIGYTLFWMTGTTAPMIVVWYQLTK